MRKLRYQLVKILTNERFSINLNRDDYANTLKLVQAVLTDIKPKVLERN